MEHIASFAVSPSDKIGYTDVLLQGTHRHYELSGKFDGEELSVQPFTTKDEAMRVYNHLMKKAREAL